MDDKMIDDLFQLYEKEYGFKITNAEDLFTAQGNLLKYIMKIGKQLEKRMFNEVGTGYGGNSISKNKEDYEFKENKKKQSMGCSEE
jgi:hypothetical protein